MIVAALGCARLCPCFVCCVILPQHKHALPPGTAQYASLQGFTPLIPCRELPVQASRLEHSQAGADTCMMTSSSSSDRVTTSGASPWLRPFTTPASAASVDASRSPIFNFTLMPELCARNASDQPCAMQQRQQTEICSPTMLPTQRSRGWQSRSGLRALPSLGKEGGDIGAPSPGVCRARARTHPSWLPACASCRSQAALRAHPLPCASCWRARAARPPAWRLTCRSRHLHAVQE